MKQNIPQIEGELLQMRSPSFSQQLFLSCFCSDARAQPSLTHRFERRAEDSTLIAKFHFCPRASVLRTVTEGLAFSLGWVSFRIYSAWYPICAKFQLNCVWRLRHLSRGPHHHFLFFQVRVGQVLFLHLLWWLVLSAYWVPLNKILNPCWAASGAVFALSPMLLPLAAVTALLPWASCLSVRHVPWKSVWCVSELLESGDLDRWRGLNSAALGGFRTVWWRECMCWGGMPGMLTSCCQSHSLGLSVCSTQPWVLPGCLSHLFFKAQGTHWKCHPVSLPMHKGLLFLISLKPVLSNRVQRVLLSDPYLLPT